MNDTPYMLHYKRLAGQYSERIMKADDSFETYRAVADDIMQGKHTKGARAALLCGLVVGALCERGTPAKAEILLNLMANRIDR